MSSFDFSKILEVIEFVEKKMCQKIRVCDHFIAECTSFDSQHPVSAALLDTAKSFLASCKQMCTQTACSCFCIESRSFVLNDRRPLLGGLGFLLQFQAEDSSCPHSLSYNTSCLIVLQWKDLLQCATFDTRAKLTGNSMATRFVIVSNGGGKLRQLKTSGASRGGVCTVVHFSNATVEKCIVT